MKKITCAMITTFLITPCLAEIHINPNTVIDIIKEFVPEENVFQTISEYNAQLKASGGEGISAQNLWKVCEAAGWNVEEAAGMQQCFKFADALIGYADSATVDSANKIKECVGYIMQNSVFIGPFKNHNCKRLVVKVRDDYYIALNNDEATALSPVWNWDCSVDGKDKNRYLDGTQEFEKDACTTVENMKAFIANSKQSCDKYSGYELRGGVCMPEQWGDVVLGDDTGNEQQKTFQSVCEADGGTFSTGKNTYNQVEYDGQWCDGNKTSCAQLIDDLDLSVREITNGDKVYCFVGTERKPVQKPKAQSGKTDAQIDQCIKEIYKTGLIYSDADENKLAVRLGTGQVRVITQQEALSLSKNWNYSNMKLYKDDGRIESHERDACDVLKKLNNFVNNLNSQAKPSLDAQVEVAVKNKKVKRTIADVFNKTQVNLSQGRALIKLWAKETGIGNITCAETYETKNHDDYIVCTTDDTEYTIMFDDLNEGYKRRAYVSIAEKVCELKGGTHTDGGPADIRCNVPQEVSYDDLKTALKSFSWMSVKNYTYATEDRIYLIAWEY